MAKVTINIPDLIFDRMVDAIANQYGYQAEIEQPGHNRRDTKVPNPVSRRQHFNHALKRWLLQSFIAYEVQQAEEAARQAKIAEINADVDLDIS